MRMTAKDPVDPSNLRVVQRTRSDFPRQTQEPRVQPIEQSGQRLRPALHLLQLLVYAHTDSADEQVAAHPAVELVSVYREMALPVEAPHVSLVNRNAHQVRHHVRKPLVVIALDPDDFDFSLRIGQLANVGKELPVVAGEPAEVQVGEYVSEQDEPAILDRLQ